MRRTKLFSACLVTFVALSFSLAATASATLTPTIGKVSAIGMVPVTLTWNMSDPGGVGGGCFGDWAWQSATITIREGQGINGKAVATLSGGGKTGTASTTLPAPAGWQDGVYTAWLKVPVSRPISGAEGCEYWGGPGTDERTEEDNAVLSLPYPDDDQCTFTVLKVSGAVGIEMPGNQTSVGAKVGSTFSPGATMTVKAGGSVEIQNGAGSIIKLDGRDKIKFTRGNCKFKDKFSFKLFFGSIWSTITDVVGKEKDVEVVTDNATIGVRGTVFRVSVSGSGATYTTTLKVTKGKVKFHNPKFPAKYVMVKAGKKSSIKGPNGKPSRPR